MSGGARTRSARWPLAAPTNRPGYAPPTTWPLAGPPGSVTDERKTFSARRQRCGANAARRLLERSSLAVTSTLVTTLDAQVADGHSPRRGSSSGSPLDTTRGGESIARGHDRERCGRRHRVIAVAALAADVATVKVARSDSGLPWTVVVSHGRDVTGRSRTRGTSRLLSLGLGAILLLLAGELLVWRVMQRELPWRGSKPTSSRPSRTNSETPLTSLRHVTELREESDEVPPERVRRCTSSLGPQHRASTSHGRVGARFLADGERRRPYDMQPLDAAELASKWCRTSGRNVRAWRHCEGSRSTATRIFTSAATVRR